MGYSMLRFAFCWRNTGEYQCLGAAVHGSIVKSRIGILVRQVRPRIVSSGRVSRVDNRLAIECSR